MPPTLGSSLAKLPVGESAPAAFFGVCVSSAPSGPLYSFKLVDSGEASTLQAFEPGDRLLALVNRPAIELTLATPPPLVVNASFTREPDRGGARIFRVTEADVADFRDQIVSVGL